MRKIKKVLVETQYDVMKYCDGKVETIGSITIEGVTDKNESKRVRRELDKKFSGQNVFYSNPREIKTVYEMDVATFLKYATISTDNEEGVTE